MHVSILIFSLLAFNLQKDWYKIETNHFVVYYHAEIRDFAERAVVFLEEKAYPHISELLKIKPRQKIKIVFGDFDDIGNGLALEIFNQVIIFTADIYFIPFRGRHPWLEDVIVHELTHIFALKKVKKMPDAVPSVSISGGLFCAVGQKICGVGNIQNKITIIGGFGISYIPYSEPAYFTEGIAQLVTAELGYDSLDSYRDMIIRTLLYHNKIYPLEKLGNFEGKSGFEGEIVYNHGFSFLTFIKENYGWETILKVMDYSSKFFKYSYQKAFEHAIGKNFEDIEKEWKIWLQERYKDDISIYDKKKRVGEKIKLEVDRVGLYKPNIYFVYQPRPYKGGILLIQDRNLVFYKDGKKQVLAGGVQSYSVQGTQIALSYPKPTKKFAFLGSLPELYLNLAVGYIVEDGKKFVIKDRKDIAKRASYPSISPDGKKIIYVKTESDSRNLFMYDLDEKTEKKITDFKDGKQFMFPNFSPDGKSIVAAYFDGKQQDIVLIDLNFQTPISSEENLKFITYDEAEDRDPVFIDDDSISFASDRERGVFNIYVAEIGSRGGFWKLTEEISGTLFPYPISEESFVYVSFEPEGFRPKVIQVQKDTWEEVVGEVLKANYDSSENHVSRSQSSYSFEKAPSIDLSNPLFVPSVGLTLTPLLTSSSTDFFIPLDIFGFSLESFSFDVLGRMQLGLRGFLGMRGSLSFIGQIDSFHFESFIPSFLVGFSRYRATPITDLEGLSLSSEGWTILSIFGALPIRFPLIYGGKGISLILLVSPFVEYYKQEVKTGGLTYLPFGQSYSSTSVRGIAGIGLLYPLKFPVGQISFIFETLGSVFRTHTDLIVEQFGEILIRQPESYETGNVQVSVGANYSLPVGFEKNFSILVLGRGGYTFRNVSSIDEFVSSYPGYLQVFFGDASLEGNFGTILDLWSGYLNITDTSALHRISIGGLYSLFSFIRQKEDLNRSVNLSSFFKTKYFSSLSFALLTSASIFYRYGITFQFVVSRGFQDPLKAPFRIYFGIGLGI